MLRVLEKVQTCKFGCPMHLLTFGIEKYQKRAIGDLEWPENSRSYGEATYKSKIVELGCARYLLRLLGIGRSVGFCQAA